MDSTKAKQFESVGIFQLVEAPSSTWIPKNEYLARCYKCGALVRFQDREQHLLWHSKLARVLRLLGCGAPIDLVETDI